MKRNFALRLILDPAIDLAAADGVRAFPARALLICVLAPLLAPALGWDALVWALVALALEFEQQSAVKRRLSQGRIRRADRYAFLARALRGSMIWASGPSALFMAGQGHYRLAGLIWAAGMALYAAALTFRAPAYALSVAVPIVAMFVAALFAQAAREPLIATLVFAAFLIVFSAFALHAAVVNHQRESDLRRTRRRLTHEAAAVRHLAFHDQLTGLVNRRQLTLHLLQAVAHADEHGDKVAVLLIDLDRFKFVNDTYGHACGDELLREVAQRLQETVRPGDVCARLGGDEFVILAPKCTAQEASATAQRVLKRLLDPMCLTSATVHTAGSIGVSLYSGGAGNDANLLRQADLALYRVKEHGRNGFCFFEIEMDRAVQSRRGLEAALRDAVSRRDISVVYQPQFEGDTMVGVEALARWNDPARGPISPVTFIPLAEECGLIEDLGMLVIQQAFEDSWRWPSLQVSINLSPVQLKLPSFLENLQVLIESSGVAPERIAFELAESVLLADDIQTQHSLAALRGLGFGVTLDDFGAGHSSLGYLRRFPIDRIKIDRSFIAGLPSDKVSEAVVHAIVQLGHTLGLEVIAEGVETHEQLQVLSRLGCRSVQGFLTGCPTDATNIRRTALIENPAERMTEAPS